MEETDKKGHDRQQSFERTSEAEMPSRRSFLGMAAGGGLSMFKRSGLVRRTRSRAQENQTPWLHVAGNQVKDPSGKSVILRGVYTADPKHVNLTSDSRGKNTTQVIDLATDEDEGWYSNVVHLPIEPAFVGETEERYPQPVAFSRSELENYLENHLDQAVKKCKEEGVYCLIDFHRHRLRLNYTNPELDEEVRLFWDTVAPRYADQSHVLYQVYKEPIEPFTGDLEQVWSEWRKTAQPWVDLIREHAPRNPVLISSPRWSQLPEGAVRYEEFEGDNLLYTLTVYPQHILGEERTGLDEFTGSAWKEVPLFVSEWGYDPGADTGLYRSTTSEYGKIMRDWLSERPIHWTAWCFDPIWEPNMFDITEDGEWELLTGEYQGEFIKDFLAAYENGDVSRQSLNADDSER